MTLIGTILDFIVKLTPCASHDELTRWETDLLGDCILYARVTAAPEKGKANQALVKLLSKTYKMPKSAFHIIRGELSRTKTISAQNPSDDLLQHIQN